MLGKMKDKNMGVWHGETSPGEWLPIQRIKWKLAFLQKSKSGDVHADGIANSYFAITSRKINVFHLLLPLSLAQPGMKVLFSSTLEMEAWGDNRSFANEKKEMGV